MNQKNFETDSINLLEIWNAIRLHAIKIVIASIVCGLIAFIYSTFFIVPLYSASALMIVNSGDPYDYLTQDQINSSVKLANTYGVIITSDAVLKDVKENLDMKKTFQSEVKDITVESVNETQIMRITVTATESKIALDVCDEITDVAPDVIGRKVKADSVEILSKASTTWKPISPNIKRNTEFAVIFGFVLSSLAAIIVTLMDNRIKSEKDIRQMNLILLGVIPICDSEEEPHAKRDIFKKFKTKKY